ncbi:MAG: hypothetical protein WBC51_10665 [Vicinamibacterales bacterium]
MKRPPAHIVVLLALMTLASGFVDLRIRQYPERPYTEFIPRVVDGTADAPERYRVLIPFTTQAIVSSTGVAISTVWHVTRLAWFFTAYLIFYNYLRRWFGATHSMLGTALVAATVPLTYTNSWAHPDHIPELALFTAGCAAIAANRVPALAAILAVATLNRETAVFLVPLYLLAGQDVRRRLGVALMLAVEWAAIYVGLRVWRGFAHYEYGQFGRNLQFLKLLPAPYDPYARAYAYFALVLFGSFLYLAVSHSPGRPIFMTRALWVVPMFGAVAFTISSIVEARVFTPLYALVLPSVIFGWQSADTTITVKPAIDPYEHKSPQA